MISITFSLLLTSLLPSVLGQYGDTGTSSSSTATSTAAAASASASNVHQVAVGKNGLVFTPDTITANAGDKVEFTEADISDWMFMRNGKIVGGETIKPTLKSLPKADADALRARMEQP